MKKLFVLALASLFVIGLIAETAIAEERLQLNGSMRVRAFNIDDGLDTTEDESYWDQRLRVGATLNVAEGVKVVSRMDFAEEEWGTNWDGSRFTGENELQVDRAYLQVDKGIFQVTAGQQYLGLGNYIAYDNNATGLKFVLKTPVSVTLGYTKESERGGLTDDGATEDLDSALLNIGYAADNFSVAGFYAQVIDHSNLDYEPRVFGVQGTFNTGMLAFNAELNVFGGDITSAIEAAGIQFYLNAEAALMENFKLGLDLVYSDGNDDADEVKITGLNNWNGETWSDRGPFRTDLALMGNADIFDPTTISSTAPAVPANGAEFGNQDGAIGGGVYAVFTPVEGLDFHGQIMYLFADEDRAYDSLIAFNLGAEYFFAPNTSLALQYNIISWDSDVEANDDSEDAIAARLQVTF